MACIKRYRVPILLGAVLFVCSVDGNTNSSRVAEISSTFFSYTRTSIVCPSSHSCRGRCSTKIEWDNALTEEFLSPHCHCDPRCDLYQDCCADYRRFCGNQTSPKNIPPSVCRRLNEQEPSMWVVESCPSSYNNKDVQRKCETNEKLRADRLIDMLPVTYFFDNRMYKNKYCAICNGAIHNFGIVPTKIRIRCNISPPQGLNATQTMDYMLDYCVSINFELEKEAFRRFCFPTKNSCPAGASPEEEEQCTHGPAGVLFSTSKGARNYRNAHCMSCHGINPNNATCGPQETPKGIFNPKSFEVVMNFKPSHDAIFGMAKPKSVITCEKTYAYDKHLEVCRPAIQDGPAKSIKDKYRIMMWLSPLDKKQPQNFSHTEFIDVLTKRFVGLLSSQIEVKSIKVEERSTLAVFDLHARYTKNQNTSISGGMQLDVLINFTKTFEMEVAQRPWLVLKVTAKRLSCAQRKVYPPGEYFFDPPTQTIQVNNSKGEKVSYSYKQYYVIGVNYTTTDELKYAHASAIVCRSFFGFECDQIMLAVNDNEYVMFSNKSLLFKPTGQRYAEGEYDMVDDVPWICTNYSAVMFTSNNTGSSNKNNTLVKRRLLPASIHTNIRRYMTIVGLSISILCLFLVLLVHGILRDLRDPLPGKNLISLSVSLFLAHFWYLLGSGDTDKPVFCHVTACLLHYLFLASFGCTFVVAYDTRRTFSATTAKAHTLGTSHQARRLAVYLLISWGIPLLLVVTCALLDWLDVVAIGYRNKNACWIGNETALLVVFAAPVGLVLVYNVLAFTQTIYAINSARKQTQRVKSSHYARPATVKIYIRLISLMGFSWFFGISAPLIHHGLMYPFVFFTTLQGLYIFLAFICKARVLRMLKGKLPLKKGKQVRRPTKGATTTTGSLTTSTPYSKYPAPSNETQM